ncbi:hypothetical protein HLRTI_001278 [Halorhabdus tiamatea SARL4B]|uniref:Uncharacterized protein n=1 Tax=Halorhabdus tiamatea SARL4B TaxID=1033806 RepID=U2DLC5_9EURY|nr:hypothetical protein HLRTI_001278 [Halorhabdus tiamatea SARL4B]
MSSNNTCDEAREIHWHKALDPGELPSGRVEPVSCDGMPVAITHYDCQSCIATLY